MELLWQRVSLRYLLYVVNYLTETLKVYVYLSSVVKVPISPFVSSEYFSLAIIKVNG
jgi:hypothetical protein